jgi:hypothetical protein
MEWNFEPKTLRKYLANPGDQLAVDAVARVLLIFEKIVDTPAATPGENATYNTPIAATKSAYSNMSWPLLSGQILSAAIR